MLLQLVRTEFYMEFYVKMFIAFYTRFGKRLH